MSSRWNVKNDKNTKGLMRHIKLDAIGGPGWYWFDVSFDMVGDTVDIWVNVRVYGSMLLKDSSRMCCRLSKCSGVVGILPPFLLFALYLKSSLNSSFMW